MSGESNEGISGVAERTQRKTNEELERDFCGNSGNEAEEKSVVMRDVGIEFVCRHFPYRYRCCK